MAHLAAQLTISAGHADPFCLGGSRPGLPKEPGSLGADPRWCSYRRARTWVSGAARRDGYARSFL